MKNKINRGSLYCFIFAFLLVYISISPLSNMIQGSDAETIWGTITSFYSGDMQPSYVLYKGIHSVYPYVWLYELSKALGADDFCFIKIYFAMLFAYVASIGLPYIMSRILKKDIHVFLRAVWALIAFWIWERYGIFGHLWVDLPNFSYLVIAAVAVLKLSQTTIFTTKTYIYCLFAGLMCGLASGGSGQYSLTVYLLLLYVALNLLRRPVRQPLREVKVSVPIICIIIVISGIAIVKFSDHHFERNIVQPFRERGEWIPERSSLFKYILLSRLLFASYGDPLGPLPDNRGQAILKVTEGANFENEVTNIKAGGGSWSNTKYIKMILQHPFDFLSRWGNRLFWALDMDNGNSSVTRLFIGFTFLYISLFFMYKNCKTVNQLLSPGILIIAAFIIPSLIPCLTHIEKRYIISIQALVIGVGLFDGTLNKACFALRDMLKQCKEKKSINHVLYGNIPYPFVIYIIFISVAFLHHATLMETVGAVPGILFSF